jgi:DNA-binding response OmpR family regulator
MDLGANDYITKPFDAEQLLAAVSKNIRVNTNVVTASQHSDPSKLDVKSAKTY